MTVINTYLFRCILVVLSSLGYSPSAVAAIYDITTTLLEKSRSFWTSWSSSLFSAVSLFSMMHPSKNKTKQKNKKTFQYLKNTNPTVDLTFILSASEKFHYECSKNNYKINKVESKHSLASHLRTSPFVSIKNRVFAVVNGKSRLCTPHSS